MTGTETTRQEIEARIQKQLDPIALEVTDESAEHAGHAGAITGGSRVACRKGSLIRIDLWQEDPPRGELVWLVPPKVLVRG